MDSLLKRKSSNASCSSTAKSLDSTGSRRSSRKSIVRSESISKSYGKDDLVILRRKDASSTTDLSSSASANDQLLRNRVSKVHSVSEDVMSGEPIRMMGYLEKRSKVLVWKRYWFVLDGYLLTYYKSKQDYDSLSPFVGSISLGSVTFVRPIQSKASREFCMQIVSRNKVCTLRSSDKRVLEQWVLALQETISIPPKISSPIWADPGVQFYRYSFASLSDWSIDDTSADISASLKNLPRNFYLKNACPALKQKCQSLASLPTSSAELFMSSSPVNPQNSANDSIHSMYSTNTGMLANPVRNATSMVVLESSPQASELKQELAAKLSIGSNVTPSLLRQRSRVNKYAIPTLKRTEVQDQDRKESLDCKNFFGMGRLHSFLSLSQSNSLASIAEGTEPVQSRKSLLRLSFRKSSDSSKEPSKKRKGFGKFLNQIFKRDSGSDELSSIKAKQESMIISGPVDLRQPRVDSVSSLHSCPEKLTTNDPGLQSPDKVSLTSLTNAKPKFNMITELKNKQLQRSLSNQSEQSVQHTNELIAEKHKSNPTTESESDVTRLPSYNEKLEKFNRLSSHLQQQQLAYESSGHKDFPVLKSRSSPLKVEGISQVCETQDDAGPPPMLPPKKRHPTSPEVHYSYDIPKNNRPLSKPHHYSDSEQHYAAVDIVPKSSDPGKKQSFRELFGKKHSAPEVINFEASQSNPNRKSELQMFLSNSKLPNDNSKSNEDNPMINDGGSSPVYYSPCSSDQIENIYEDIKYATIESIFTEYETVEHFADEESEEYDEFVVPTTETYHLTRSENEAEATSDSKYTFRHSGMDALQSYLKTESDDDEKVIDAFRRVAAVNRLGKSLAVEKLEHLIKN